MPLETRGPSPLAGSRGPCGCGHGCKRHPRNAKRAAALCVPVLEQQAQKRMVGTESRGQEDSVLADPFIRKIARRKRHPWEYCYWKEHFPKEFL